MNWREEYKNKLRTADEVASLVKSGDRINLGGGLMIPDAFCMAMCKRFVEVDNLLFTVGLSFKMYDFALPDINKGKCLIESIFLSPGERQMVDWGTCQHVPIHLSQLHLYQRSRNLNVCAFMVTPPDEDGYFNKSGGGAFNSSQTLKNAEKVVVEVNPDAHWCNSDDFKIHVSEVDYIIESDYEVGVLPPIEITETEQTIGGYVADMIPNGSTLQIGFGGLADAVGNLLKSKKDLSIYAETFTSSMAELCKSGVVNGANNPLIPGIASASFAFGSKEMHQYVHKNKDVTFYNLDWINDPNNIAKNKNLVGVNGTLCMDLTGQACSESIGLKQFSATGGQVDFARGISLSETSKFILALPSTFTTKDGEVKTKIDITLPPGSVVTTPRIEVDYVVTDYGVAHLKWKNLSQRAHEMIKIAHPDFRDELKFKAKKAFLI